MSSEITYYPPREERLNIYSHGLGFVLSLVGGFYLIQKGIEKEISLSFFAYTVYAISLVVLYAASTFYHMATTDKRRHRLNIFDHSAIYLLIAGTYYPISLVGIGGVWGLSITIVVSVIAIVGIVLKFFFVGRFRLASTLSYVGLGCVVLVAIKPLVANVSTEAVNLLFVGNGLYVVGAVLYSIKKIPFNHAIFHLFVLGGSISHFIAIYFYL